jgi:putative Mg2+ transporter-C (MgtC) family protein
MHLTDWLNTEPHGQSVWQLGELCLALLLSALIGFEREFRMKSAGLRTHTLVGVASALIMLVSKYGFADVIVSNQVVLDPSRVAAQIVSGIGFIGGGLIFVQKDTVRGLTTAAAIWLTAAVGMACGAGLPLLALFVTAAHFIIVYGFAPLERRLLSQHAELLICYVPGKGAIQEIVQTCTGRGFVIHNLAVRSTESPTDSETRTVQLEVKGRRDVSALLLAISDVKGVASVQHSPPGDLKSDDPAGQ